MIVMVTFQVCHETMPFKKNLSDITSSLQKQETLNTVLIAQFTDCGLFCRVVFPLLNFMASLVRKNQRITLSADI